jgi:NDP-sugar pyrophosphorylase family protein
MPPLFDELPTPFRDAFDPEAPWSLLGEPLDAALAAITCPQLAIELPEGVHLRGSRIAIGEGTEIYPGAVIEGPVWIGAGVEIRTGAFIRKDSWIGDGAVVGANTEVKRSILLPAAKAPHLAYVGDSILGSGVNLGAGRSSRTSATTVARSSSQGRTTGASAPAAASSAPSSATTWPPAATRSSTPGWSSAATA